MAEVFDNFEFERTEQNLIVPRSVRLPKGLFHRALETMTRYMETSLVAESVSYTSRQQQLRAKLIQNERVTQDGSAIVAQMPGGRVHFGGVMTRTVVGLEPITHEPVYAEIIGPEIVIQREDPEESVLAVQSLAGWYELEASVRNETRREDVRMLAEAAQSLEPLIAA
jgi:hypothetical protein